MEKKESPDNKETNVNLGFPHYSSQIDSAHRTSPYQPQIPHMSLMTPLSSYFHLIPRKEIYSMNYESMFNKLPPFIDTIKDNEKQRRGEIKTEMNKGENIITGINESKKSHDNEGEKIKAEMNREERGEEQKDEPKEIDLGKIIKSQDNQYCIIKTDMNDGKRSLDIKEERIKTDAKEEHRSEKNEGEEILIKIKENDIFQDIEAKDKANYDSGVELKDKDEKIEKCLGGEKDDNVDINKMNKNTYPKDISPHQEEKEKLEILKSIMEVKEEIKKLRESQEEQGKQINLIMEKMKEFDVRLGNLEKKFETFVGGMKEVFNKLEAA